MVSLVDTGEWGEAIQMWPSDNNNNGNNNEAMCILASSSSSLDSTFFLFRSLSLSLSLSLSPCPFWMSSVKRVTRSQEQFLAVPFYSVPSAHRISWSHSLSLFPRSFSFLLTSVALIAFSLLFRVCYFPLYILSLLLLIWISFAVSYFISDSSLAS